MGEQTKVTGVILCGGLARRMGQQDKGLVNFKGKPLVAYAIDAMVGVAEETIINANRNITAYEQFKLPVINDLNQNFDGPLAGILTAMTYAKSGVLVVMPCDSPFVRSSHLKKLLQELTEQEHDADVAVAFDGMRLHPVFLAVKAKLMPDLQAFLQSRQRKVEAWLEQQRLVKVDYSGQANVFININSMAELGDLENN